MIDLAINGGTPVRTRPFPSWPEYDEREEQALLGVLRSRHWSSAPLYFRDDPAASQAYQFEQEFAAYHGVKRAIAVSSGTSALQVAYRAAGVGLGDEVILPALTFIATASPILQLGAIPVFVDIEPESRCISPDAVGKDDTQDPSKDKSQQAAQSAKVAGDNQGPVYAARISLDRTQMQIGDKLVNLAPGMSVTAEIRTGERRIISYLLSPLRKYRQDTLRER